MSMTTEAEKSIDQGIDLLVRTKDAAEARAERAATCGAELARAVYRYVQSPQEVGRAVLRDAYSEFMAAHAGNFGPGS